MLTRAGLAHRVYPDSPRESALVALRQSLVRLRRWVGDDSLVVSKGFIRAAGDWRLSIATVPSAILAAGFEHPVFREIRNSQRAEEPNSVGELTDRFSQMVSDVSAIDPDEGRSILVVSSGLIWSLRPEKSLALMYATRPKSRRDPFAYEHSELLSRLLMEVGQSHESEESMRRGMRIATHSKNSNLIARGRSQLLFIALETGQIREASEHLRLLRNSSGSGRLTPENASAAYDWNVGEFYRAISSMQRNIGVSRGEARTDQLHFWVNATVLASEAGDMEFYLQAREAAESFLIHELDLEAQTLLHLADLRWRIRTDAYSSVAELSKLFTRVKLEGWLLLSVYISEALALACARLGDLPGARSAWAYSNDFRKMRGWRNTPRVAAIRSAVLVI